MNSDLKYSHIDCNNLQLSVEELGYFAEQFKRARDVKNQLRLGTITIDRLKQIVHRELCAIFGNINAWRLNLAPKRMQNSYSVNISAGNVIRPLLGGRCRVFCQYVMLIPTLNDLYWVNAISSKSIEPLFIEPSFWVDKFMIDYKHQPQLDDVEQRVQSLLGKGIVDIRSSQLKMRVLISDCIFGFWDEMGTKGKRCTQWQRIYWLMYFDNWLSSMLLQFWAFLSKQQSITDDSIFEYEPSWGDNLPYGMEAQWIECCEYFEQQVNQNNVTIPLFWKDFAQMMRKCPAVECTFDAKPLNAVGIANCLCQVMNWIIKNFVKQVFIDMPRMFMQKVTSQ